MTNEQISAFLHEQMKPVYGYCLSRCASLQDAQDVTQEILLRTWTALGRRRDLADPQRYLWTIARNTLTNHYRDHARCTIGLPPEAASEEDFLGEMLRQEDIRRLHDEIGRLTQQQRQIVSMHYFHGLKQQQIADALSLSTGTVKWHLFEARKELKKHMSHPRDTSHLRFDPIRFSAFYNEGSIGTLGSPSRVFASALNQNIAYACWQDPRSAAQIADDLGVSPVYIEDAANHLAEQGYLNESGGRYQCAILLTEWNADLLRLWDEAHRQAAALIAPALLSSLSPARLSDPRIGVPAGFDRRYALWALIPWLIACDPGGPIPFSDAATRRPDGAHNLCHAMITPPGVPQPTLAGGLERVSGPCWNARDGLTLWQMDTPWSPERIGEVFAVTEQRIISLLRRLFVMHEKLNEEECSVLLQRGVLRLWRGPKSDHRATLQAVWLQGSDVRRELQALAGEVYQAHQEALSDLCRPLADALAEQTPPHLLPLRRYTMQGLFHSHRFILHCLEHLTECGLLSLPDEAEKTSLHTIVLTD